MLHQVSFRLLAAVRYLCLALRDSQPSDNAIGGHCKHSKGYCIYISFHPIALKMLAGAQRLKQRRLAPREGTAGARGSAKNALLQRRPSRTARSAAKELPRKTTRQCNLRCCAGFRILQSSCIFLALPCILSSLTCLTAILSEQAKARSRRMHVLLLKVRKRCFRLCADCICACRARASM